MIGRSFSDGPAPDLAIAAHDHLSPDCRPGKHGACSGDAWCTTEDRGVPCTCPCHDHAAVA